MRPRGIPVHRIPHFHLDVSTSCVNLLAFLELSPSEAERFLQFCEEWIVTNIKLIVINGKYHMRKCKRINNKLTENIPLKYYGGVECTIV
jgi:hypothetical protein